MIFVQLMTKNNTKFFTVFTYCQIQNSIVSFLIMRNFHLLHNHKVFSIENSNMSMFTNNILIKCTQVNSMGPFVVILWKAGGKIVWESTSINGEPWLTCFIGYAISYVWSEHHLRTFHEVAHYVIKYWLQGQSVDFVKVNLFICGDLDAKVTFNKI